MKQPRSSAVRLRVVRLAHALDLPLPRYQTAGSAGLDLVAAVPAGAPIVLKRGARALVPTGLVMEFPARCEAQVRPRSGLALRHGVTVLNSPGTIDSDYRGEIQVILINLGDKPFSIQRGERIAQLVVQPVMKATLVPVAAARKTLRGGGGFGSTGTTAVKRSAKRKASSGPGTSRRASTQPRGRRKR